MTDLAQWREKAAQARRLVRILGDDYAATRLKQLVAEIEAHVAAIEAADAPFDADQAPGELAPRLRHEAQLWNLAYRR